MVNQLVCIFFQSLRDYAVSSYSRESLQRAALTYIIYMCILVAPLLFPVPHYIAFTIISCNALVISLPISMLTYIMRGHHTMSFVSLFLLYMRIHIHVYAIVIIQYMIGSSEAPQLTVISLVKHSDAIHFIMPSLHQLASCIHLSYTYTCLFHQTSVYL